MNEAALLGLASFVSKAGLVGKPPAKLLEGFCLKAVDAGLPIARVIAFMDTLHPTYEGRAFRWDRGTAGVVATDYEPTTQGERAEVWRRTPFYQLLSRGETVMRRPITEESQIEFPLFRDHYVAGLTEFVAIINPFAEGTAIGEMDCFYSAWTTDRPEGFRDDEVAALTKLAPFLGLAIKSATLAEIAETLVVTYLGRDAGQRVLRGRIARGVAEPIDAVLWFSDLRNYTRICDTATPAEIVPLLNDYADAIVTAIHRHSGDVLKLIGDGVLAIFPAGDRRQACVAALAAAEAASEAVNQLNARRAAAGAPVTEMYLGLHVGEVHYGNIGSRERLDFTVVGPAVNEVSRIASMCRSLDQPVLVSSAFAASAGEGRPLVSVGRYALRGVQKPQELYTLDG